MNEKESDYIHIYQKNHFIVKTVDFSFDDLPKTDLFHFPFAIITAWNPNNEELSEDENQLNNGLLKKELEKHNICFDKALGYLDKHQEESFCVYDISFEEAINLGRKFHQYAIFYNDTKMMGYYNVDTSRPIIEKIVPV